MKPIPVVFHIGPLQVHTYGIGLAITFWFGYRYFAKRLRDHGFPDEWLGKAFVWIIASSIVGARAVHVISMWSFYSHHPGDILAIWHGGLSSYGGLLLGVPVGMWCAHRWCPKLRMVIALDLVAPVLAIAWSVGRLLGPQLMVQGGGYRTTAWYGMYYAGQVGKRLPVPLIQATECFVIWVVALQIEKFVRRRGGPLGLVVTAVVTLYGLSRTFDESVLLPHGTRGDLAVIAGSRAFVAFGVLFGLVLIWHDRHREVPGLGGDGDPWAAPDQASADAKDAGSAEDPSDRRDPSDSQHPSLEMDPASGAQSPGAEQSQQAAEL